MGATLITSIPIMQILSSYEIALILSLTCLIGIVLTRSLRSDPINLLSPITFISAIYLIYTVVGPLAFLVYNFDIFPTKFSRQFYITSWKGSLISYIAIVIGYNIWTVRKQPILFRCSRTKMFTVGVILNAIALILYGSINPSRLFQQLNPFSTGSFPDSSDLGGFVNYFNNTINFLIIGTCLILLSIDNLKVRSGKFLTFVFFFCMSLLIYMSLGFRYRILLLLSSVFVAYYLKRQTGPSMTLMFLLIPVFLGSMGVLGLTRSYGLGLDLTKARVSNGGDFVLEALRETNVFIASGAVINAVPSRVDFVGFDIIENTLVLPIPRKFIPNKDTDSYIRAPIKSYKQFRKIKAHRWAAMLFFAEWYSAYGWIGLVLASFILGKLYRALWDRTLRCISNEYMILIYAVSLSFLYVIITRGYLPGVVMLYAFSVAPAYLMKFLGRFRFTR